MNLVRVAFKEEADNEGGAIGGAIGGVIGGAIDLTDRQKEVLELIEEENTISYKALAEKLGINESAVGKHIEVLKEKKVIERVGGTRGYWRIKKK